MTAIMGMAALAVNPAKRENVAVAALAKRLRMNNFGRALKRLRGDLTQKALSEASGVPRGTIGDLESRNAPEPSWSTAIALAKALNVPLDAFVVEQERESSTIHAELKDAINRIASLEDRKATSIELIDSPERNLGIIVKAITDVLYAQEQIVSLAIQIAEQSDLSADVRENLEKLREKLVAHDWRGPILSDLPRELDTAIEETLEYRQNS